jgi:hypothetical protein
MRADIHSLGVATWWVAVRRILGEGWDDAMKEPRVASGGRVQSCVAIQSGESYHSCHLDNGVGDLQRLELNEDLKVE